MLSKKMLALAGLLTIAAMLLSACAQTTATPETIIVEVTPDGGGEVMIVTATPTEPPVVEEEPKTFVICQGQEPDTLYLWGGSMLAARHVQHAIYDGPIDSRTFDFQPIILQKLPSIADGDAVINAVTVEAGDMVVDDSGEPVELAEGVVVKPAGCTASDCAVTFDGTPMEMDQMVVTFKLLEGLLWSDGEPLTAADSVYSYQLYMDPDTPNPSRYVGERSAAYEATDDITAVWTGLPGYLDATYFANFWNPMPEHQLGGYSAAEMVEAEEASRTPMGWGAFIITEWVAGDHITAVKNPNYFRADEGLPYVDEVVFRFGLEDANASIAALLAGDCDLVTSDTGLESQAELLTTLEAAGELIPTFVTGTVWEHIDFGVNSVPEYEATRPDYFEDLEMRQAIAYCIDRQSVVDSVYYGRSIVIGNYIPPDHPLYNPNVTIYPYDPEQGMALLDGLGWTDSDGDGVRECNGCTTAGATDGQVLNMWFGSTTAAQRVAAMQVFQQNLAECGIQVELRNMPAGEWFADPPDAPLAGRRFDLGMYAWSTGVQPPCELYLGAQIPAEENGWAGQNYTGWSTAEYDAVCNAAIQTLPGMAGYEESHLEAQRIFSEQIPTLPLYLRLKLAAYAPYVSGFIVDQTENSEMWNIEMFDLDL